MPVTMISLRYINMIKKKGFVKGVFELLMELSRGIPELVNEIS